MDNYSEETLRDQLDTLYIITEYQKLSDEEKQVFIETLKNMVSSNRK